MARRTYRADLQASLVDAATELLAARGFAGVALQDVAERVAVTKQTVLYHFKSKEALRVAVIDRILRRANGSFSALLTAMAGMREGKIDLVLAHIREYLAADPRGATVILRFLVDGDGEAIARIKRSARPWFAQMEQALREAQRKGEVRADLDEEALVVQLGALVLGSFALHGITYWTRRAPKDWTQRRLEALVRVIEHALVPDRRVENVRKRRTQAQRGRRT